MDGKEIKFSYQPYVAWIWAGFFLLGCIFRMIELVGGAVLLVTASGGLIAYNLSAFIRLRGENQTNNLFGVACLIVIIVLVLGAIFNGGYPVNYNGLMVVGAVFLLTFGIQELVFNLKGS